MKHLEPFIVTSEGIQTRINQIEILFNFVTKSYLSILNMIQAKEKFMLELTEELKTQKLIEKLNSKEMQDKIQEFQKLLEKEVYSDLPNAFWHRKKHIIHLPYIKDFNEENIPTKARPTQMNSRFLEIYKKEIQDLLHKKLIRESKSPWSCIAFYVENAAELERGVPRLVINYKPLNKVLQWICYPIPDKSDLIKRIGRAKIFYKFDMKLDFLKVQIAEEERYKTGFTVPFGHYEWNVIPFGLKNALLEFQKIMNDILSPYTNFSIVYIDNVLIFSDNIDHHWKHLKQFLKIIEKNDIVVSARKIKLFQSSI